MSVVLPAPLGPSTEAYVFPWKDDPEEKRHAHKRRDDTDRKESARIYNLRKYWSYRQKRRADEDSSRQEKSLILADQISSDMRSDQADKAYNADEANYRSRHNRNYKQNFNPKGG